MTATPPPLPAMPRTAHRGMSRGAKIALFVGLPVLALAGIACVVGFVMMIFGLLRESEPYKHAVAAARADARVQAALGTPIHEGLFVNGSISTSNDSGDAHFSIPLDGPRGKAQLIVVAHRDAGAWQYRELRADLPSGAVSLDTAP